MSKDLPEGCKVSALERGESPAGPIPSSLYPTDLGESFLNALYNGLSEAVIATNLDTRRIVYWNKGAEALFGYSAREALGQTTEFLYPDHASFRRIHEISAPVVRERGYWRGEWEFRRRDGSLFPAEATATAFLRTEGGEVYIVYVVRDLTERKEAEKALRWERDFAESLVETAQAIVLILDPQGRIVRFNPYLETLSGYRLSEVQGRDWFVTFFPGEDRDRVREAFLKVLEGTARQGINPIVTREGQKRFIAWSSTVLKDPDGNILGVLAIGQDVTERVQAEAWLQSLIETTQDAIVAIDRKGCIVLFNPAAERIFGYSRAEVQGKEVSVLMPEPYAREHRGYIERYEKTREARAIGRIRTVAARRKSGEVFPIELSVAEVQVEGEVRYAALIRDISEKVRLQEKLLEKERLAAIGTTAAKFAHEIGNPLNSLYMGVQLLERHLSKRRDGLDERVLSLIRNLRREISRLGELLQEFRSLSRRQELRLRPTSVAEVVAEVLTAEAPHYEACGIAVEQKVDPHLPAIVADRGKLKQVLLNLFKNAAEAMPGGGKLTVRGYGSQGEVRIEVRDTGVGIPEGADVFALFTTTKPQGLGLGLAIARQIVIAHGGTITYESSPGQGTTFTLTLPVSPPGALPPQA